MSISLPDARSLPDSILEALRFRAIRGCELGYTHADLADLLGVARGTITRWWDAYKAGGIDALPDERTGRPLGSGRALDDEQAARIRHLIDSSTPENLGIAAPAWSRRAVRDLIRKEFGIDLAERTVGEYLARWGYTAKRPARRSKHQDPEKVRVRIEETYPEIEKQAEKEDAVILFGDETGVEADQHPHVAYSRKGEPSTMEVPNPHLRIQVAVTVNNTGEVHYQTYDRTMNAVFFVAFLEGLLQTTDQKILLIIDNLPAHKAAKVDIWLARNRDRIEVFHLPPRAPELNAEEYLNQDMKSNVHAEGLPDTKLELLGHVVAFMDKLKQMPERVMSYFQHPKVQYAAAN